MFIKKGLPVFSRLVRICIKSYEKYYKAQKKIFLQKFNMGMVRMSCEELVLLIIFLVAFF